MNELNSTNLATPIMSDQINEITAALAAFQSSVKQPTFNKQVKSQYTFHYADFSEVVKAATPLLEKCGLAVTQLMNGGRLITLLAHKSGQWFRSEVNMGDQAVSKHQAFGSALTYLKRYSYCAILGIVADDDDDANRADNTSNITVPYRSGQTTTDADEAKALAELSSCKTEEQVRELYAYYRDMSPEICKKGKAFYEAVSEKIKSLREQTYA